MMNKKRKRGRKKRGVYGGDIPLLIDERINKTEIK